VRDRVHEVEGDEEEGKGRGLTFKPTSQPWQKRKKEEEARIARPADARLSGAGMRQKKKRREKRRSSGPVGAWLHTNEMRKKKKKRRTKRSLFPSSGPERRGRWNTSLTIPGHYGRRRGKRGHYQLNLSGFADQRKKKGEEAGYFVTCMEEEKEKGCHFLTCR